MAKRTTGSKSTKLIAFRIGEEDRRRVDREAKRRGVKPNAIAKAALLRELDETDDKEGSES